MNRCWDKYNLITNVHGSTIIVATIGKILNMKKKNTKIDADITIFDEAHHASAKNIEVQSYMQVKLERGQSD